MKKNINNWNSFSRGLFVALLLVAIFCGICALGAAFCEIPWLLISGAICILLILSVIIWVLGYLSHKEEKYPEEFYEEYNSEVEQEPEQKLAPSKDITNFNMFPEENDEAEVKKSGKFERVETPEEGTEEK